MPCHAQIKMSRSSSCSGHALHDGSLLFFIEKRAAFFKFLRPSFRLLAPNKICAKILVDMCKAIQTEALQQAPRFKVVWMTLVRAATKNGKQPWNVMACAADCEKLSRQDRHGQGVDERGRLISDHIAPDDSRINSYSTMYALCMDSPNVTRSRARR
ncbi:hypothetical protein Plhal304r1_c028g0092451 [Plasmopara halstedii]